MLSNCVLGRKALLYIAIALTTSTFSCKDDDPEPAPVISAEDFLITIEENPVQGAELGTITASSNRGTMIFSLKSESAPGAFAVGETTGKLSVLNADLFDFEKNATLTAVVLLTNGKAQKDVNVTVSLQKEPDPIITTEDFSVTIDENPEPGTELGTITASSDKGTMTFSLKSESVAGAFSVEETTGEISVLDADKFDFENNTSLSAVIVVKNGDVEKDVNVTVNLQKIIWEGAPVAFTKTHNADWTLPANQDNITNKVIFTRQNKGPIYNYKFWIDTFEDDATYDDLYDDFWNDHESLREFTRSGGTQGVRWAILDDTDADTEAWDNFALYGTLGDPTHFYSFHAIASAITALQNNENVTGIVNDFSIEVDGEAQESSGTLMPELVGKKLGIWLVEEDIYLTFSFTHWGSGEGDNSVSYTRATKD
jgi:hypothetical protein